MDGRFKLRISRIFHNSCKSRDDVANSCHDVLDKSPLLSPSVPPPARPLPRPSICNPRTPPSLYVNSSCIISSKDVCRRTRTKARPPVARFSHFAYNPFYDRKDSGRKKKRKEKKKKKSEAKAMLISHDRGSYSSDDEREDEDKDDGRTVETLFSSSRRSLSSSESSENCGQMMRRRRGGVKGSMAVVKKSRDPEGDFRRSMVEMIMERQIFGEEELQRLLLCFLALNSTHHHNIIIHVFKEIWDTLFRMHVE